MRVDREFMCDKCGCFTTEGRCISCRLDRWMVEDDDPISSPTLWCELCGVPISGAASGKSVVDVCEECGEDIKHNSDDKLLWDESIHIHPYITD